MMVDAEQIAYELDRNAKYANGSWTCRCPAHNDRNPSLSLSDGKDRRGRDIVLWHCYAGCSQEAVAEALRRRGLLSNGKDHDDELFVESPPEGVKPDFRHFQLGEPDLKFCYRDRDGNVKFYVCRFDTEHGKQIRPLTYGLSRGRRGWHWKWSPGPRTLYRLEKLDKHSEDATVLIVEGEKTARAIAKRLPEFFVTTWSGGSKRVAETDWSPLQNRAVVLWPDNDAPGRKAMQQVAQMLVGIADSVRIVQLPLGLPDGWDLADPAPHDVPLDIEELIKNAPEAAADDIEDEDEPKIEEPIWPAPLGEAAYYGVVGDFVRAIEPHTESDPAAVLVQLLVGFGNIAGRSHYDVREGHKHPPLIWSALVGLTSKGRKGTGLSRVLQLLREIEPEIDERIASGLTTGEGLIWHVRDPIVKLVRDKETKELIEEEIDPGVQDKRLLVLEEEFASVLRQFERQGSSLSATLRRLWDTGAAQGMTKTSPGKTTNSMVSIIAHITRDELRRYLTHTEMANGLANRFIFVCVKRSKKLPFGGEQIDLEPFAKKLSHALRKIKGRGEWRLIWTDEAHDLWCQAYERLSDERPGLLGAVTARSEAQALRLIVVYALVDGAREIQPEHVKAGLEVWRYCEDSAAYIFGNSLGDAVADEILRALRSAAGKGLTRTQIYHLFSGHQNSDRIDSTLSMLITRGLVRSEKTATGGRPVVRWFATNPSRG